MKFIHVADIHLDSPLVGLQQYEGAPVEEIRGATRRAFQKLIDLAIAENVSFVVVAGDLYDGDWKDYNTGLFFAAQMTKLREAGIRVFLIAGNHDAASQITRYLRMPDNVSFLSVRKPESVILDDLGLVVHGQGFHSRAVIDDLSIAYPERIPELFNIGLLHTSADGREGHEPYAPCSLPGLLSKNYDYWALGHVHKYEVLNNQPWVLFPGNIQGRHIRETGPKGCVLVTTREGRVLTVEHRELDVLRWSHCSVDSSGASTVEEVMDNVVAALNQELTESTGRPLAVRLRILGACKAHRELSANIERWTNEIRLAATDQSGGSIWIEKVKLQTRSEVDLDELADREDALGGLLRTIRDLDADQQFAASITSEFSDLFRKLPPELRTGNEAVELENPETLGHIMEEVRQLLLDRLLSQGD